MRVFLDTNVLVSAFAARDSAAIIDFLTEQAGQLTESSRPVAAAVDEDDAIVLGNAVDGHAEVFVTGDAKVLALRSLGGLRIVSPRAFWELLQIQQR